MRRGLACAALVLALAANASAQDTHYWSQKYGSRSLLLGGVVIGSVVDLSGTYYNPGGVALLDTPLILTAKAFEHSTLRLENGAGPGLDLETSQSGLVPTFVSGTFPRFLPENHTLYYSFFPRFVFGAEAGARQQEATGGTETFGEIVARIDLDESWAGLTWSYRVTERLGIGVSQYLAVRSQFASSRTTSQRMDPARESTVRLDLRGFDYTDYRLLWKAGVAWHVVGASFGANVTSPSVHIAGSGKGGVDVLDVDTTGSPGTNEYAVSLQEASSDYRSPLAAGFGASYTLEAATVHASVEWFEAIGPYDVLKTTSFVAQGSGATVPAPVVQNLESVVNWGVALEYQISPRTVGFAAFATDYSSNFKDSGSTTSFSTWDTYLVTVGSSFTVGKSEFTLGAGYGFGDTERLPLADIAGQVEGSKLLYRNLRLIFGFSI